MTKREVITEASIRGGNIKENNANLKYEQSKKQSLQAAESPYCVNNGPI